MDRDPLTDIVNGMPPYQMPATSPIMPGTPCGMPMAPGTSPAYGMPQTTMPGMMPLCGMPYMPGMHPMDEEMMEMRYIVALLMLHIDMCLKHMHMYHGM